eukprot:jgi/Mesen1/3071/ME001801S02141
MVGEIRDKAIGMMTLVALAISVAFIYSVAVVFGLPGMDFFWELATLIDIMLLGHWLEMRSQMTASRALESLVALLPSIVHVESADEVHDVSLKELKTNDIIIIKPGEKVPADGIVLEGSTYVNESMLTGESVPVKKEKDVKVIGGSVNGDGSLRVKVTGTGSDSYLNKVINLVQSAQAAKSTTQNLADKVAKWLTIISILVGVGTLIYWLSVEKDLSFALERMVTVMVTSCPHALGVAIPLVVALSTTLSATHGLLIRNRTAFEMARKLTTIIFDKTGTLTKGSHEVEQVIALSNEVSADEPVGIITLADSIRETSAEAVNALKQMHIKSFLLTGDNEKIATAVANKLGMYGYLANVLPHEKQVKVKEFQDKGEIVAMTGDGVNDAPALAQADVGIAVGSGTDVAAETADIILVNSEPKDVVQMISFGKATYKKMIQNLAWAVGYNVVAIPLAAGVLYPYFTLSPAMGAVLMSLSTIIVAINASLLKVNNGLTK